VLDNIGLPSGVNLAFGDSASIGSGDGEILIALKESHQPTPGYQTALRNKLREQFPQLSFFFQPANITNQILNFGLPAPIDVQVTGRNAKANAQVARQLVPQIAAIPGAVDVHLHQELDYPEVHVNVDRVRAQQIGLSQRDVANSMLVSLSSSGQTAPNFWLNPTNGVNYPLAVQTPQHRITDFAALGRTPITSSGSGQTELLDNLASLERGESQAVISHYDVQPTLDIFANVEGRDLGAFAADVDRVLAPVRAKLPKGTTLVVRGQSETMRSSFSGLLIGLVFAIAFVYLLMVVNFQSWLDPFIILMSLPGALGGILWMLFLTQTPLSVPAMMGSLMCVGVATANSILLVTFANDQRTDGKHAREAAHEAGVTRIRPVIMTALAMIIGMLPMALALGEGGEQNAPLGRAVIGGLLVATVTTLFVIPLAYSVLRGKPPVDHDQQIEKEEKEKDEKEEKDEEE